MKFSLKDPRFLTQAAIIAALYAALTLLLQPISGFQGNFQLRVSEALTLLPVFTPAAVPGLFVGCLIANLLGGATIMDVIFGSLATLLAAFLTRRLRFNAPLAALAPVLVNMVVVGLTLSLTLNLPLLPTMGWVGLGQLLACYALGLPLVWALRKAPVRWA